MMSRVFSAPETRICVQRIDDAIAIEVEEVHVLLPIARGGIVFVAHPPPFSASSAGPLVRTAEFVLYIVFLRSSKRARGQQQRARMSVCEKKQQLAIYPRQQALNVRIIWYEVCPHLQHRPVLRHARRAIRRLARHRQRSAWQAWPPAAAVSDPPGRMMKERRRAQLTEGRATVRGDHYPLPSLPLSQKMLVIS